MNIKLIGLCGFGLLASSAFASYAADTFDPFGNYNAVPNGYYVDYGGAAFRFQALASGSVDNITAAISNYSNGSPLPVNFSLWTDSGNGSPSGAFGTQIGSTWSASTSGLAWYAATPISVNIAGGPTLTAGNWYWLAASSGVKGIRLDWSESLTTYNPYNYFLEGGIPTTDPAPTAAYSVSVKAVPEPSSFLLLALAPLAFIKRFQK